MDTRTITSEQPEDVLVTPSTCIIQVDLCLVRREGRPVNPLDDSQLWQVVVRPRDARVYVQSAADATHSQDYRSVNWFGEKYQFSPTQAACVHCLWEAWEEGTPAVGQETILQNAGSESKRLVELFKGGSSKKGRSRMHAAWGTMIVPGEKKGLFQLKEP